jgi:flagellar basal body-associated protein FliL
MKKSLLMFIFLSIVIFAIAQTVYITKTGSKYHSDGCRYLSRSCIPISLSEAKSEGYDPCSVCDPPTYVYKRHVTHQKKSYVQNKRQNKRHYYGKKI